MDRTVRGAVSCLLWRVHGRLGAIPLASVEETLRPLPIDALPDVPPFVSGISIIRGKPTPVIDVARLFGATSSLPARIVVVRTNGARRIALAVEQVLGIRNIPESLISELPPLVGESGSAGVEALAALDGELLVILQAARLVSDDVWSEVERLSA